MITKTLLIAGLLFGFIEASFAQVQIDSAITAKDALIKVIQERATRDVELGKPMQSIGELNLLYGKDAAAAGMTIAEVLDCYELAYDSRKQSKPWWGKLRPEYGWIAALVFFVLFLIQDIVKKNLTRFFEWVGEIAYKRLAGYRLFWWISLKRYRQALYDKYRELKIPFRPGRPLDMKKIYVPLKVAESNNTELVDAYQAIAQHTRLVVVGSPGAGKSMLLRNLALTFSQGELSEFSTHPIPILLELNRLNESNKALREHLIEVLEQNDFPRAGNFIDAGLERGLLLLLFDGFDEVNSDLRGRVTNQIKDLLANSKCQAVVTCRSAVYDEEFADWANQKLKIDDFNDQQIQLFLSSWQPDMPQGKSIEHLLRNLHERPLILLLARNPLLLTIIAYLYTDTEFVLPHSRAEFYDKSVDVLLEQWKEKRNRYKGAHKRLVLQHLALYNQDSVHRKQDRRTIELSPILTEIKKVLPSLTLKDEDAQPMLDEIVERSGLLIEVDGGLGYQFTHLTLQEFFAAEALKSDTQGLIKRFTADPDAWRETIKLCCGLEHDCTQLIRSVYEVDKLMAFECLGDAQKIDAAFADEIITAFQTQFTQRDNIDEAVLRAFAVVAADPRPRGEKLLGFLMEIVSNTAANRELKLAAAQALTFTNLPQAARVLAEQAPYLSELRPLITQMGDIAVPSLVALINGGHAWAFDGLYMIGTPSAAKALVPLLWDNNKALQYQAAWRMAALLPKPNVEDSLREYPLNFKQREAESMTWVWEPFEEDTNSTVSIITGRVAHLLSSAPPETVPSIPVFSLDTRIVIPLCSIGLNRKPVNDDGLGKAAEALKVPLLISESTEAIDLNTQKEFVDTVVPVDTDEKVWCFMFRSLSIPLQFDLLRRFYLAKPTRIDWRNIFRPADYEFEKSWHARGVKLIITITSALSFWGLWVTIMSTTQFWSWENGVLASFGLAYLIGLLALLWFELNWEIVLVFGILNLSLSGLAVGMAVGGYLGAVVGTVISGAGVLASFALKQGEETSITRLAAIGLGAFFAISLIAIGLTAVGITIYTFGVIIGGTLVGLFYVSVGFLFSKASIRREVKSKIFGIVVVSGVCVGTMPLLLFYFPTKLFINTFAWDWSFWGAFWLIWILVTGLLLRDAAGRHREAENPFRGLLKPLKAPVTRKGKLSMLLSRGLTIRF